MLVLFCTAVGWWLQAAPSAAAGPATSVTVTLNPASIEADGSSTSTATATVTDATSAPVPGDTVAFSASDPGIQFSAVTDHGDGTYTTTITSSTTAGSPTITATDATASVSGSAVLTQTSPPPPPPPPATSVYVALSPSSIVANGTSTSTAAAVVTDADGDVVTGDNVEFSASDRKVRIGSVSEDSYGTWTATIRSSTTAHAVTITATDTSANISGRATLTQTKTATTPTPPTPAGSSATKLSTAPSASVTDQPVTLIATVTSGSGTAPSGTVTFENDGAPISGCADDPVETQGAIITCLTSFAASTSPARLTAVFRASAGSSVAGSTSATDSLVVGRDSTSTTVSVPNAGIVKLGTSITYTATIASAHGGAFETGSVAFEDGGTPIPGCASRPIGTGPAATCTVSYAKTGTHDIKAVYSGDANFNGSASSPGQAVGVVKASAKVLGIVGSTMQWTFLFTPSYTKVLALVVNSAPFGSRVVIQCKGGGCPFHKRSLPIHRPKPCHRTAKHKCSPSPKTATVHLLARFRGDHLQVGARIMIKVVRARWIGKYYGFVMRARRAPKIRVACLAPGSSRPGVGC